MSLKQFIEDLARNKQPHKVRHIEAIVELSSENLDYLVGLLDNLEKAEPGKSDRRTEILELLTTSPYIEIERTRKYRIIDYGLAP